MNLNQDCKFMERSIFDQTKQTFVDKLKNYQTLTSFSKSAKLSHLNKLNHMFSDTGKSTFTQQMSYSSPRFGESLSKRLLTPSIPKNTVEEFKQKLYGKLDACPESSYSLIRTKFNTQQKYFEEQFEKQVHEVSLIEGKFESFQDQHSEQAKENFMSLQGVEKYLVGCQKAHHQDYTLVSQKSRQIVHNTIHQSTQPLTKTHKSHLQTTLQSLSLLNQQSQTIQQSLQTQSQLSQHDWCSGLDKINDEVLALNALITETKIEENNRFTDMQWRVKEVEFACEEGLERERKERMEKEARLYMVLEKLIQRVGEGVV